MVKIYLAIRWDGVIDQICMVKACLVIRLDDVIDKTRVTANYPNTHNCASFCLRAVTSQRECDISNWTTREGLPDQTVKASRTRESSNLSPKIQEQEVVDISNI